MRADGVRGLAGDFLQVMRACLLLSRPIKKHREALRPLTLIADTTPRRALSMAAFTIDENRTFFQFREK